MHKKKVKTSCKRMHSSFSFMKKKLWSDMYTWEKIPFGLQGSSPTIWARARRTATRSWKSEGNYDNNEYTARFLLSNKEIHYPNNIKSCSQDGLTWYFLQKAMTKEVAKHKRIIINTRGNLGRRADKIIKTVVTRSTTLITIR